MNAYEQRAHQVVEYIKLHEISLLQDAAKMQTMLDEFSGDLDSFEYQTLELEDTINTGELQATRHILSVVADILGIELEEK